MSGLRAAISSTSRSFATLLTSLRSQSTTLFFPTVPIHRRSSSATGNSNSSPPLRDDLEGLIGPDVTFASDNDYPSRENLRGAPLSSKDFAFLRESINSSSVSHDNDAMLIVEGLKGLNDNFGDRTEKFLRQFRGKLDENLVVEVLGLVKDPTLTTKFFLWAGRQIGFRHSSRTCDTLLEVLRFNEKSRAPQHLLQEIGADDSEVLGKLFNVLVRKCCRDGCWNEALEELGRLKDFGYKASRATYNALMQVFLEAEKFDSAYLVYREMLDAGHAFDRYTMGCFVSSLCKLGRWEEALDIMEKEGFTPDTIVYTKMIRGLMEASLFEEVMSFLHRMRANSCLPNVVTYRTLLSGFLKMGELGWCKRVVNMMITEGCNPSPALFNSLLHAYCRSGDYNYAYKLLKKMAGCGCRPGYVAYNILIGGICGNENLPSSSALQLAEKVYEEMLEAGCVLNKVNVGSFTRCLCGAGKFDKSFLVIKELMTKGFTPDVSTYSKVIEFLCQANKVEKALHLFEEMKRNGVLPDVYTYTILIDTFSKVGLLQQARNWFNEMKRDGCEPNVVTYTTLIHAYLKARQVFEADQLFEQMLAAGCQPNIVTYSAIVDGLCKAGKVEKACHVYDRMRGSSEHSDGNMYFRGEFPEKMEPNVFTYGALVDGLCKAYKVAEAQDLLDAMSNAGYEPNDVVYDALIDGFCKSGKLDEAQELVTRMSEHGYTPNVYTYSSLINKLFKDGRLDLALKILSRMLDNDCAPNVVTYTEMIDGLCKVAKTDEAYKLLLMMEEKGCSPNVITYTAMIDGFGKVGQVDKCLELFGQMTAKECAPNFVTYRVLINHCCSAGLLDEAHGFLEEMKQTYWPRNMSVYSNVIQGFSREFLVSHGLLQEVVKDDFELVAPAYCILVDNLCKSGRLDTALELYKELMTSRTQYHAMARRTSSSLIQSLCLAGKMDEALELYVEMTRMGGIPEFSIFLHIISGLIRIGKWDDALLLSYSVCQMVHTKRRNRLRQDKLNDLVYCMFNLKLKHKEVKKKTMDDPLCLEEVNSDDEWIAELQLCETEIDTYEELDAIVALEEDPIDLEQLVGAEGGIQVGGSRRKRQKRKDKGKGKAVIDVEEEEFQESDRDTKEDVDNEARMKFMDDCWDDATIPSDNIDELDDVQGGGD